MRSSNLQTIDEPVSCPSCGNRVHFFIKRHYQGSGDYFVDLNGGIADNTNMYSNLKLRDGKILYCADCDEPVAQWRPGDLGRVLSGRVGEEGRGDG